MKLVLEHKVADDFLIFTLPPEPYRTKLKEILKRCEEKSGGFCSVDIDRVYKPRTTGKNSQNNLFYKLCTIIGEEIGEDIESVKADIKIKSVTKGYPVEQSKITGEMRPYSTTRVNTVEMSYLIDTCYEVIAFLGIILDPALQGGS